MVYEKTKDQFEIVRNTLTSCRVSRIVCATDAGREEELIFRYIYEAAGCKKPVSRLWISSLTPDAIRTGFAKLRPGSEYDRLADAASSRSRADWLVGMNLSRAYSIMDVQQLCHPERGLAQSGPNGAEGPAFGMPITATKSPGRHSS